jgi:hypothetical protein
MEYERERREKKREKVKFDDLDFFLFRFLSGSQKRRDNNKKGVGDHKGYLSP